jgi:hypothetical protein
MLCAMSRFWANIGELNLNFMHISTDEDWNEIDTSNFSKLVCHNKLRRMRSNERCENEYYSVEIWGFHGGEDDDYVLLGFGSV